MSEDEKKEAYVPPSASWLMAEIAKATAEEVKARVVDCPTCPVFMQCMAASPENTQGGSGWVCPTCKTTGVYVDEPEGDNIPDDLLVVDCTKHKFPARKEAENMQRCPLCAKPNGLMELHVMSRGARLHYIATVHALVPVEQRLEAFKEGLVYWTKHYADKAKDRNG